MPTLEPHEYREIAESFGTDAERYDRGRPAYPDELIERVASPGREILDVGCGTGIAARQLQAAGCTVLGVEPDERMAEFARKAGTPVEVSRFEDWEPAGRTFDTVISGQAWHWVDPARGTAKVLDVLRSGGTFAAFWHVFLPPDELQRVTVEAYHRAMPDAQLDLRAMDKQTNPYQPLISAIEERFAELSDFGSAEPWRFEWDRTYTRDEWLDHLPTQGSLTRATPAQLTEILSSVGAAIDALGGSFTNRFTTVGIAVTRA